MTFFITLTHTTLTEQSTVVQIVGGTLQLESSNFVNNSFVTYPAPVITDSKSKLDLNTNNCGANNSNAGFKGPTCEGVFALSKAGACKRPSSCEGTCIPFTSLTCSHRVCYSDWGMLVNAINTAAQRGQGGVFILCPMTTFLVDAFSKSQPVIIQQSSTVLQCGDSGLRENSCVIFGGEVQILILGGATDVIFRGLTMISSSKASVNATGNSSVKATFADCEWTVSECTLLCSALDQLIKLFYNSGPHRIICDTSKQWERANRSWQDGKS